MKIQIITLVGVLSVSAAVFAAESRPNVLVILTDDQGYADAGFQGFPASKEVLTPNLDKLAASGIVFHNGYTAFSTCGPSRASLLTGRSASRFGVEENDVHPPTDEILIPHLLKPQGYISAAFGKWHLGTGKGETPLERGFDYYYGDIPAQKDYFMKRLNDPPSWENGTEKPTPIRMKRCSLLSVTKTSPFSPMWPTTLRIARSVPTSPSSSVWLSNARGGGRFMSA
jgi:hypothetical protein